MADALLPLIASWAAQDVKQPEIADRLNQAGVPGPRGGQWVRSTVSGLFKRAAKAGSE
ncbi:MAG: recombinase family protein, partial [Deltaproteobacteria bacterium]|nr:recombinase family protein [Deltaproteobacteria bacterium]